ncbi:ABC transporter [Microbacterium sp.]|uniref:ABC transporter n=1 Tax=Microbacterium sp. TaxID=51671 RepID=UPI0028118127|nr:ABC transporter [Microbacterium sp.]
MSDPEVPKNEQPHDVDHVVGSANEGLDAAAAARGDVPGAEEPAVDAPASADSSAAPVPADDSSARTETTQADAAQAQAQAEADADAAQAQRDADLAAFEAAERDFPGTFGSNASGPERADDVTRGTETAAAAASTPTASEAPATSAYEYTPPAAHEPTVADTAYGASAGVGTDAETRVVPAEPVVVPAPQPIFVQAPEPPRELGNRGAAGAIGLIAAIAFGILYLAAILGFGALSGDVTAENLGESALAPLTTWSFWVPVVVFFLAFWLLGAFINRGRWGKWVIFGLFVGAAAYGGHLLGQLFQEPFWRVTASESAELVNEQLLAPLAIAAFIFGRELTIWFGAWVARSGARKKALNAEAQAEYERTLEAGPAALR